AVQPVPAAVPAAAQPAGLAIRRPIGASFLRVPLLVNKSENWAWKFLERRKWRLGAIAVCPKVRLEDVINAVGGEPAARGRIKSRHVDFLLVDGAWRPLLAVEVDGSSHDSPERRERDAMVDGMLADAGVPVLHLPVGGPRGIWDEMLTHVFEAGRAGYERRCPTTETGGVEAVEAAVP
ncbi:MAG: DUF2726 domain-containing protein, partial [Trebonia sp.]